MTSSVLLSLTPSALPRSAGRSLQSTSPWTKRLLKWIPYRIEVNKHSLAVFVLIRTPSSDPYQEGFVALFFLRDVKHVGTFTLAEAPTIAKSLIESRLPAMRGAPWELFGIRAFPSNPYTILPCLIRAFAVGCQHRTRQRRTILTGEQPPTEDHDPTCTD